MIFQLLLCEEFFLAIKALEDFFHVYEHVFLQRLSVDKHLTAVVTEHAGIQQVVVLQLQMFLHLSQFLEVLTAAVAAKRSHLGAGVGRPVTTDVREINLLNYESFPALLTGVLDQVGLMDLLMINIRHPGVECLHTVAALHLDSLELLLLLLVAPLAARGLHDLVHLLGEPPPLLAAHHAPLILPRLHQEQHLR